MCSIVSKKIALSSEEWTVGQILSACKLFVYSFLTSFIANEPDKEVVAWAILPVFANVKVGPSNAEYWVQLLNSGSKNSNKKIRFTKAIYIKLKNFK